MTIHSSVKLVKQYLDKPLVSKLAVMFNESLSPHNVTICLTNLKTPTGEFGVFQDDSSQLYQLNQALHAYGTKLQLTNSWSNEPNLMSLFAWYLLETTAVENNFKYLWFKEEKPKETITYGTSWANFTDPMMLMDEQLVRLGMTNTELVRLIGDELIDKLQLEVTMRQNPWGSVEFIAKPQITWFQSHLVCIL